MTTDCLTIAMFLIGIQIKLIRGECQCRPTTLPENNIQQPVNKTWKTSKQSDPSPTPGKYYPSSFFIHKAHFFL